MIEAQAATTSLSAENRAAYARDGYLFPLPALSAAEAAQARRDLEGIERDWLDNGLPLALNQYKRVNAQVVMPLAARLATNPRVLDAVAGILGPDLMVWSAEFFIKEPRTRQIVSMHQDLTYWGLGATQDQVTAWIALSPATVASGCMDFVAGSHKNPILPHHDTYAADNLLSRGQEVQVDVRPEDRVAIELQPGQMSLHHGLTIHGSGPNTSDDRRIGFAVRYLNPNARQQVADRDYAMMARGVDRSGAFVHYAPPDRLFAAESLRLYEQIRQDQTKALAAGAKADVPLYAKTS